MNNFDTAFSKISDLVNDFKQNEKRYLSPEYQEAEVRRDFIDKFFEALGWDIFHNTQKNPWEQEVKVEKGLNVGRALKRADYAFYITPNFRDPKFYAEAKKPSRNLKNTDDYFQTIRYGWNANTPIAVLTDFEEFHIIDCRNEPRINDIFKGYNQIYHYSDYLNQEKFSEIYYLLSRDFVYNGSIEKYVDNQMPKPRGSASKRSLSGMPLKSIDESFLEFIDDIRLRLAKAFKKNDANLDSNMLTEATQKTIDRLVFIRFLEDKLIEPENIVSEFGSKYDVWNDFIYKSKELNTKYNGIVFKKHFIDDNTCIGPERKAFESICESISHKNSKYDFNAIPIHILGSIYERFLGKVVNATPKQVKVEEKPEVRKAGGVYYTPKYIVDYIVANTIGKILNNCHSRESSCHSSGGWNPDETQEKFDSNITPGLKRLETRKDKNKKEGLTPDEISKLRFADIACGSGSFLIGAFDCLLEYHNKYYQAHPAQAKKDGCIDKDGQMILSIKQKQKILLNNIYGVDIDPQAVEVTQLSLALKMLEDETLATANEMQVFFHEQILPNLTKNIVCGNSLIGTDILTGNMFASDEERKLNPMDFETTFPQVFTSNPPEFIPMKSGKGGRGDVGFDAIIGNPPYGAELSLNAKKYLINNFNTSVGNGNTYVMFMERSIRLLNNLGISGILTPTTFLSGDNFEKLRIFLLKFDILSIIKLPYNTFKDAYIDTSVIVTQKKDFKNKVNLANIPPKIKINSEKEIQSFIKLTNKSNWINSYKHEFIINEEVNQIKDKIFSNCIIQLENIATMDRGTLPPKTFIEKNPDDNKYYYWFSGQIYRYNYIKELLNVIDCKKLKEFKSNKMFNGERILLRQLISRQFRINASIVNDNFAFKKNLYCVYSIDNKYNIKYLLGLINSKLFSYYIYNSITGMQKNDFPSLSLKDARILPIKKIDFNNQSEKHSLDKIVQFVDQMLESKKQLQTAKTDRDKTYYERKCDALDKQIDSEVYKLYNLTEEEIKIVEEK